MPRHASGFCFRNLLRHHRNPSRQTHGQKWLAIIPSGQIILRDVSATLRPNRAALCNRNLISPHFCFLTESHWIRGVFDVCLCFLFPCWVSQQENLSGQNHGGKWLLHIRSGPIPSSSSNTTRRRLKPIR